jgi:intein/homing endonuclease
MFISPIILNYFIKKTLTLQEGILKRLKINAKNGTLQKKAKNGIESKRRNLTLKENLKSWFANFAAMNIKQSTSAYQNSVITIAKLQHLEKEEKNKSEVYDLMIEECHEYFANGILVHNCIDPTRYFFAEMLAKSSMSGNTFRFVK